MEAYGFYLILFFVFITFIVGGVGSIIYFLASAESGRDPSLKRIERIRDGSGEHHKVGAIIDTRSC